MNERNHKEFTVNLHGDDLGYKMELRKFLSFPSPFQTLYLELRQ